jgi:hypothetical protein
MGERIEIGLQNFFRIEFAHRFFQAIITFADAFDGVFLGLLAHARGEEFVFDATAPELVGFGFVFRPFGFVAIGED